MGKFLLRFLATILIFLTLLIVYLSYVGIETSRFDNHIKQKVNKINQYTKLEFNKTKILLNLRNLELNVKLKDPRLLIKGKKINLSKIELIISVQNFYKPNIVLENANIEFKKNDIKDLTKITRIFFPSIINKKINKVFSKGLLEGIIKIPFTKNGKIGEKLLFNGKILDSNIHLSNEYKLQNLTAKINYEKNYIKNSATLKININKGSLLTLNLINSEINIDFKENKKIVKAIIHTKGETDLNQIKKISSFWGYKFNNVNSLVLKSSLITEVNFILDNKFKIKKKNYKINGNINSLNIKTKKNNNLKKFIPSFNQELNFRESKISFVYPNVSDKNQTFTLDGEYQITKKFKKINISQFYKKQNKSNNIKVNIDIGNALINIPSLNYKKNSEKNADLSINISYILKKFFIINNLSFSDDQSKITLKNLKLDKNLSLYDFEKILIKTFNNNKKNNDFKIVKSKDIVVSGSIFDAEPLLKSLFQNNDKNFLSKNFSSKIKVNFNKTLTGTLDDVSDFSMIAVVKKGSYQKFVLKGNFTKDEKVEMSLYQVNPDKKTLEVVSDRARPFVKNFEFIKGFEGGKLFYDSVISKKVTTSNLSIVDFKVSKVPSLAKLLSLASLQGIADTLTGEGIRFDSFEMKSNTEGNVLNIVDVLAMGPAISILLDGYVDKGKLVSLRGTLVPATKLNSIIASIPLVGGILVGKKTGDGIVGVSFKMKGPPKDIKTTVNPIKTLTPRFIVRAIENLKKKKKD